MWGGDSFFLRVMRGILVFLRCFVVGDGAAHVGSGSGTQISSGASYFHSRKGKMFILFVDWSFL